MSSPIRHTPTFLPAGGPDDIYVPRRRFAIKGPDDMEIILDRKLVDKRVFPAIDIRRSGTREEELLIPKADLQRIFVLRRVLNPLSPVEAMELLITYLEKSRNNAEFLINMNQL
jgi:transcription termination factor Rho